MRWRNKTREWLDGIGNRGAEEVLRPMLDNKRTTFDEFKAEAARWNHPVPDALFEKPDDDTAPSMDYVQALAVFDTDPAWDGVLGFDEGREEIIYLKPPPPKCDIPVEVSNDWRVMPPIVKEEHVTRFGTWFRNVRGVKVSLRSLEAAVIANAKRTPFDWMRDRYFKHLPKWDERARLDGKLCALFGVDESDKLAGLFFKKHMVAAVRRTLEPGVKVDNMLMLVGQEQGSGKTEGVARLLPHPDLFSIIDGQPNDPDTIYQMLGCKFAVLDELLNFNDFRGWKSFLTKRVDKKRLSYGRRATLIERRCVWWGITNEPQFLTDVTGNRRYLPVEIPDGARVDWDGLEKHRDLLWAEALHLAQQGYEHWLSHDEEKLANERRNKHVVEVPYAEKVRELLQERLLQKGKPAGREDIRVSSGCVWGTTGIEREPSNKDLANIRRAMQHVGLEPYGTHPVQIFPLDGAKKKKARCWIPTGALYEELAAEHEAEKPGVILDNTAEADVKGGGFWQNGEFVEFSEFQDN